MVQDLSFHHRPDLYPPLERARLRTVVPRLDVYSVLMIEY